MQENVVNHSLRVYAWLLSWRINIYGKSKSCCKWPIRDSTLISIGDSIAESGGLLGNIYKAKESDLFASSLVPWVVFGMLPAQPLPTNNPYAPGMPVHQAYATCVALETDFPLANYSGPPTPVCARLLGYLIIHAPTQRGHVSITNEINSCNGNKMRLHELALFYVNHFLRFCE